MLIPTRYTLARPCGEHRMGWEERDDSRNQINRKEQNTRMCRVEKTETDQGATLAPVRRQSNRSADHGPDLPFDFQHNDNT